MTLPNDSTEPVAMLGVASAPLPQGLRAAAHAYGSGSLRRELSQIADALESGCSIDQALASSPACPPHIRALIAAASKSRDMGQVVLEITDHRRRHDDLARMIYGALLYPMLIVLFSLAIFSFLMIVVVSQFKVIFQDFGLKLPSATLLVIWWSDTGIWILLSMLGAALACVFLFWLVMPGSLWRFALTTIPFFGPLWLWAGTAEWARWMQLLLSQRIELPEVLRLAAVGVRDASIARASQRTSQSVESGMAFPAALWKEPRIPASVIPFVISGEKSGALPDAFQALADLFEERVRDRARIFGSILPQFASVFVCLAVLSVLPALFVPFIQLISGLSG